MYKAVVVCFVVSLVSANDYQSGSQSADGLSSNGYGNSGLGLSSGYSSGAVLTSAGAGYSSSGDSGLSTASLGSALSSGVSVDSAPTFSLKGASALNSGLSSSFGSAGLGSAGLGSFGSGLGFSALPAGFQSSFSGFSTPGRTTAAIQSRRTFEIRPVSMPQEPVVPQIIEVEPSEQPVQVIFRSVSSPVLVQQIHTPGTPGKFESTRSEDEPHRVVHEVLRPLIQEVREVIQPYRRVTQEVRPVLEEVHTVVAKGEKYRNGGAYGAQLSYGSRSSGARKLANAFAASGYGRAKAAKAAKGARA